jgi:hypothetical protein
MLVEISYCAQHDQFFLFLFTSLCARSSKQAKQKKKKKKKKTDMAIKLRQKEGCHANAIAYNVFL